MIGKPMAQPSDRFAGPSSAGNYGFTCQIWLATRLQTHLGNVYHVWFAREFNPLRNGDSSNPLEMYADMDKAVKRHDINHPKLKDLRARLLDLVNRRIGDKILARELRRQILRANAELFRPQLWRIDLSKIASSRVRLDQSRADWDEQYIRDLAETEFEIIVE